MSDLPMESRVASPVSIPVVQQLYWSVRCELWENRSIYIAPLAVAALFIVGFTVAMVQLRRIVADPSRLESMHPHQVMQMPYNFAALVLMGTTFLVAIFYCLDALYGERRDRSILFWKSLPISDLTTVLSKFSIPMLVLPLVTFVITIATQIVMMLIQNVVLFGSTLPEDIVGHRAPFFVTSIMLLYHLVALHSLWYAPIFAWLMLVSSWARRAPFLWAVLPPFAIGVLEKVAFGTTYFAELMRNRISGGHEGSSSPGMGMGMTMDLSALHPMHFLADPGLWGGLVFAAICLAASIQMRRTRGPL
jgi:ABC-2 type transport system permease protein